MMRLPHFRYHAPATVADAAALLADAGPAGMLLSGGTDLLPNMKRRQQVPKVIIGLRQVAEMRGLSNGGDALRLGAGLTLTDLVRDERIRVAVSVACLTRYQDLIAAGNVAAHGIYYYVPGMLQQKIDTESVTGLIAPRPLLVVAGRHDPLFPLEGALEAYEQAKAMYAAAGAPENLELYIGEGAHRYYAERVWPWLAERCKKQ